MALTTENAGALLAGASVPQGKVKVRMKVRQSVCGQMVEAGEEVEAPAQDAGWLVRKGYAEYIKS